MENMLGNGAPLDIRGPLKDLLDRLYGNDGERWLKGLKRFLRDKGNPFLDDPGVIANPFARLVRGWEKFYRNNFNETFDFSTVIIPPKPNGKWWLVIVAKGMKPQWLFEKCRDTFGAWKYTDSNLGEVVTSDRTADNGHYAIWVRANVEADPQFKNLSFNKLKEMNHKGITLEERLVLELFYFWKTKKHLDIQNWTLCTGSRYSDGSVPDVSWSGGKLGVRWYDPADAGDYLRSREIVS